MQITNDNIELIGAKNYTNHNCVSTEEFLEDLKIHSYILKLSKKILNKKSHNIRLLTNYVICFTNNFELGFCKTGTSPTWKC